MTKNDGSPRKVKAAQWVFHYDPDGSHAALKRDAKALKRHQAQQRQLQHFHPAAAINVQMKAFWEPLVDHANATVQRIDDIEQRLTAGNLAPQVERRMQAVEQENTLLRAAVSTLTECVAELRREMAQLRAGLTAGSAIGPVPEPGFDEDPLVRAAQLAAEHRNRQAGELH